ncbi:hypothetical protein DFS33DRAFT_1358880 [Desarmillaria ectypa]|nr:hypothetical protein DFS33DRAFT_1358880 [Desarmillaria ectypa]
MPSSKAPIASKQLLVDSTCYGWRERRRDLVWCRRSPPRYTSCTSYSFVLVVKPRTLINATYFIRTQSVGLTFFGICAVHQCAT